MLLLYKHGSVLEIVSCALSHQGKAESISIKPTRMIFTVVTTALLANIALTEQTRIIGEPPNGEKIPLDISVKDGYVIVVSGQAYPKQPFFKQSINLYDLDKQLEARKVVDEDLCYIKKFTGTYAQIKGLLDEAKVSKVSKQVSEEWNIPGKEIGSSKLEQTVGIKIAEFCSGYRVFWMTGNWKVTDSQDRMTKRQFSASLGGGFSQGSGWSANGKLAFDNGNGFTANLGGGWSEKGGLSASVGLKITF